MKISVAILLVASSAFAATPVFAQTRAAIVHAACGPVNVHYDVTLNKAQHKLSQPEPGKALVYFVRDDGAAIGFSGGSGPVTMVGMDGAWVGANRNDSWFSVSVEPGVHHICVTARRSLRGSVAEFAHFTAEAGHTYYFRTRDFMSRTAWWLEFGPVDSDQAKYMIASYPMAVPQAKK